jgi:hypothetical protein
LQLALPPAQQRRLRRSAQRQEAQVVAAALHDGQVRRVAVVGQWRGQVRRQHHLGTVQALQQGLAAAVELDVGVEVDHAVHALALEQRGERERLDRGVQLENGVLHHHAVQVLDPQRVDRQQLHPRRQVGHPGAGVAQHHHAACAGQVGVHAGHQVQRKVQVVARHDREDGRAGRVGAGHGHFAGVSLAAWLRRRRAVAA